MKKIILLAALLSGMSSWALDFDDGVFKYSTLPTAGTVTVTGPVEGTKPSDVVIPSTVSDGSNTYTVTEIADKAFSQETGDKYLTSLTLPPTVKTIGYMAFRLCYNLSKVNFSEGLDSIGGFAFQGLASSQTPISSLVLPSTLRATGYGVFASSNINSVTIPAGMIMANSCFMQTKAKEVIFKGDVIFEGTGQFTQASRLESIVIPDNVTVLPNGLFFYVGTLKSITLPDGITRIDNNAISQNSQLNRLYIGTKVPPTLERYNGNLYTFGGIPSNCLLIVPDGCVDAYKNNADWGAKFTNIKAASDYATNVEVKGAADNATGKPNQAFNLKVNVFNYGTEAISTVGYQITGNGINCTGNAQVAPTIASGDNGIITVQCDPITAEGTYELTVTLTTVNGKTNGSTKKSAKVSTTIAAPKKLPSEAVPYALYKGNTTGYTGSTNVAEFDVAMSLKDPDLVGYKLVGMKVNGLLTEGVGNYQGFVAPSLSAAKTVKQGATAEGSELTVVFDTPVTLTAAGLIAGYHVESFQASAMNCIPFAAPEGVDGSFYLATNGKAYEDMSAKGSATITLYLTGNAPKTAVRPNPYTGSPLVVKDKGYTIKYVIEQQGTDPVTSVEYTYNVNGQNVKKTANITLPAILGAKAELAVEAPAIATAGTYPATLTINKVNNAQNLSATPANEFLLTNMLFQTTSRPLMEEATGTWCGYCTRGWMAMKLLNEADANFIGVAWHEGATDPMAITTKFPIPTPHYPVAALNRVYTDIDPYFGREGSLGQHFDMKNLYYEVAAVPVGVDLDIETEWNADSTSLSVKTITSPAMDLSNLKIGYIFVANGLSGNGKAWEQNNTYGTYKSGDPNLMPLYDMGNPAVGMIFDDVAITYNGCLGIANSLPTSLEMGKTYDYSFTIPTVSIQGPLEEELLQHKDKTEVVAFLLDGKGQIVNARKVTSGKSTMSSTAVTNITADSESPAIYYDLMGRRVEKPQHGIYIKVQGGKASKIAM